MTVWFITPWHGETHHLLPEYINAVQGGRVVVIDNATPLATADALKTAASEHGWHLITNTENVGFAPANNQGWHIVEEEGSDPDIVCFLNSDVRADGLATALEGNVRSHEALYGPSLGRQLVLGRWLPYLEGWCIAAKLWTWRKLFGSEPWPESYAPAYWEDNAVSLRALSCHFDLVHLQLPIQHLGGQSGGIARMGEVLERNRAQFVAEARQVLPEEPKMTPVRQRYLQHLSRESDIQHHLPLLNAVARGTVVELGTRTGVSTAAFLDGVERRGGRVVSIDIDDVSRLYRGHPNWVCIQADSRDERLPDLVRKEADIADERFIDVLFVDTEHTYEQVMGELDLWGPFVKRDGYILCHDTETFPGVRQAVSDWAGEENATVTYVLPNNGMGVITLGGR
jgi:predicted O-methyltransferase YrrM